MSVCSVCRGPRDRAGQRYCRLCHNAAKRQRWAEGYRPSQEERRRGVARAYLREYVKRGKIEKLPCEECGATAHIEGHHYAGYDKPLTVRWLCRLHHRLAHGTVKVGHSMGPGSD